MCVHIYTYTLASILLLYVVMYMLKYFIKILKIKNVFTPPVATQCHRKVFPLSIFVPHLSNSEKHGPYYSPHTCFFIRGVLPVSLDSHLLLVLVPIGLFLVLPPTLLSPRLMGWKAGNPPKRILLII